MSTHSFCTSRSWHLSRPTALWPALLIALLLALFPFPRASAAQRKFDVPLNQDVARAGVSVVRLVTSYTTVNEAGKPPSEVQCTGLGALVASWPAKGSSDQNTWILTDGGLVNGPLAKNAAPVTCAGTSVSGKLVSVEIFLSTAYNPKAAPITLTSGLDTDVHCQNSSDCSKGAVLFSFNTNTLFPYLDVPNAAAPAPAPAGLGLTQTATSTDVPSPANPDVQRNPDYAKTLIPHYLTPHRLPSNTASGLEAGTPLIDSTGLLVGMSESSNTTLQSSDLRAFLNTQTALQNIPTNLVHDNWDKGIIAYFGNRFAEARDAFQQVAATNGQFQGASDFAQLASTQAQQKTASNPVDHKVAGGFQFLNIFVPYWLLSIIGLVILVGILLVTSLFFNRSRQHRRVFKEEIDEANRQATIEAQRIKDMEATQQQVRTQQPSLVAAEPANSAFVPTTTPTGPLAEQRCPRCNEPLAPDARFCPNCRLSFASGNTGALTSVAAAPPPPLPPVPAGSIADQPTIDMSPGIPQDGQPHDPDKTVPYLAQQLQGRRLGLGVVTRTNPGIKRQYKPNEDNLFAGQILRDEGNGGLHHLGLFVIADGMGGHANGQDASRLAIQTIIDHILPLLAQGASMQSEEYKQLLLDGVQNANRAVHQQNMDQHGDMGTTMTASLVIDDTAYIANVGDSRTYLYRESDGLKKVTQDHSVVASLVAAGIIKPDDIYTHPKRNQIYRSLGDRPNVEIDPFVVHLQPGDKLLLCSDGLWDMVRDPQIEEVIRRSSNNLDVLGDALIQAALDGGGEDNVSVIVVHAAEVAQQPAKPGLQLIYKPESVHLPALA